MRIEAQEEVIQEDHWNHKYYLFVPNNAARKWATQILKKLNVNKVYVSRKQGYIATGDPSFIARYTGFINDDQYQALVNTYLPYAPYGVQFECPGCSAL